MTTAVSQSQASSILKAPSNEASEHVLRKEFSHTQDTLAQAQRSDAKKQVQVGERPALQIPENSQDQDYLTLVAEAFAKESLCMQKERIQEIQAAPEVQQLDEAFSQALNHSLNAALAKEQLAFKLYERIKALKNKIKNHDFNPAKTLAQLLALLKLSLSKSGKVSPQVGVVA